MQSELTSVLKEQHKEILRIFSDLEPYTQGKLVPTGGTIALLRELKRLLTKHVKLEDEQLYPRLLKISDKNVTRTAAEYSDGMLKISERVAEFFEKYLHLKVEQLESDKDFKEDLRTMAARLTERVDAEETVLFPLYDKYCADA